MAAGEESHLSNSVARGCAVRRCLVFVLYSLRAFSKMMLKLEESAVGVGDLEDEPGAGDALMLREWCRDIRKRLQAALEDHSRFG
jgi:hypothetical protein